MPLFGPPNIDKLKAGRDIPGLIKALGYESDDGSLRRSAVAALAQIGAAATGALLQALQSGSLTVAAASGAAEALGSSRVSEAISGLILLLKHPNRFLRAAAAHGLQFSPTAESIAALQGALLDDEDTARTAAEALAKINLPGAWQALQETLGHAEFQARMAAVHGLTQIGPAATPRLIEVLENGNENARRAAAELLGKLKPPEALPVLLEMMTDPSDYVALAVGSAIQSYADAAVIPLLQVLMQGGEPLKTAASQQLVRLGDRAGRGLLAALKNADPDTQARVALILGKIGGGWVMAPLTGLSRHSDPSLRYAAAQALAEIGGPGVIDTLINLLDDENSYIRHEARTGLVRIYESVETRALRNQIQEALHRHPADRA